MVLQRQEVDALFDVNFIEHTLCEKYIEEKERKLCRERIETKQSLVAAFVNKESREVEFIAVIDTDTQCIHVRHVVGNFGRLHKQLETLCIFLCKITGFETISFNTERDAVLKWAEACGYEQVPGNDNEFYKNISETVH